MAFYRSIKRILCCILMIYAGFATLPAYSLSIKRMLDQCRLDTWTSRDGLVGVHTIYNIAQTPEGYIWLGTNVGLIRFNGASFKTYNVSNTRNLTSNLITAITVTRSGELWIGTEGGGVGTFKNGVFTPLWPQKPHWHRIFSICEASDKSIYVALNDSTSQNSGMLKIVDKKVTPYLKLNFPIYDVLEYKRNQLYYLYDDNGIFRLSEKGIGRSLYHNPPPEIQYVTCMAKADNGDMWIGLKTLGLLVEHNGKFKKYTIKDGLASNNISCIYKDRNGRMWVGTNNGLSYMYENRFKSFNRADGLYTSTVNVIFEDQEGSLWVATGGGINRFASSRFIPYTLTKNMQIGRHPIYGSMAKSHNGNSVWCATDCGLWNINDINSTYYDQSKGLPHDFVDGVCIGEDGSLWFWVKNGKDVTSLYQYKVDKTTNKLLKLEATIPIANLLIADADEKGITTFGSYIIQRIENKKIISKTFINTGTTFYVTRTSRRDYWLGCDNGLYKIHGKEAIPQNQGLPSGVHVLGIYANNDDDLWLATDKGLAHYHNGISTLYDNTAGLPANNLFEIQKDNSNRLWIGCHEGVIALNISDIEKYTNGTIKKIPYILYSSEAGVKYEPIMFSSVKTNDGKIWFNGQYGLLMIDPQNNVSESLPPPVVIESAQLDDKQLLTSANNDMPPGEGRLQITFASLSYRSPEQVKYRYKLEGLDNRFTESGYEKRTVSYTNLNPGKYRFIVYACNNDNIWSTKCADIVFTLEPHFYQTTWYKILLTSLLLWAAIMVYAVRMRQMIRNNRELECQVSERTKDLIRINEQLMSAQDELTAQYQELDAARENLEIRVEERTRALADAYDRTIEGWSRVMDLRDKETEGHSQRVTDLTVKMARAIGMSPAEISNIRRGSLLHDIGKMGIPDNILLKPGTLSDTEWEIMRKHPIYAYEILSSIEFLLPAIDIPWRHHEKWDGTGYPDGLHGEEIPLAARLFSVVDVWDALMSDRPYRKGWPEEKVREYIQSLSGLHFDPFVVELFFQVLDNEQTGLDSSDNDQVTIAA